jgi:hypothetical protein
MNRTNPNPDPQTEPSARKLTTGNITASFVAAIPELTPEINLELATATQTEVFTKTSTYVLWGLIDLGTSTVQIRVPVTYRYHLCLREPWRLEIQGKRVVVHAPEFRPSLPPAIYTDQLQKLSVRGWARGSTADLLEEMQREITPTLIRCASDPRHLELVRSQCRQSVAEFVKLWLERERQWGQNGLTEIQILFPAEEDSSNLQQLQ